MSDEEETYSAEEESEEEESRDTGPSEAELAAQRRSRAPVKIDTSGLDDESKELLEANADLRGQMEEEIRELRTRSEKRKKERVQEEKEMAARRAEEEARRKKEEEERQSKKLAEEQEKRATRDAKLAEFEKFKNQSAPNFVITKKTGGGGAAAEDDEDEEGGEKKSKEQLEAEKRAILDQRIPKLDINGADSAKLTEKAKELHSLIMRLESEKYDLEKRFKTQQYDMMELAERARQMNKVGRGGLKRVNLGQDEVDVMSERFAGCPSKIEMYSKYERTKDKRTYADRQDLFVGPQYGYPAEKIKPKRIVQWNEEGLPEYVADPNAPPEEAEAAAEEVAE